MNRQFTLHARTHKKTRKDLLSTRRCFLHRLSLFTHIESTPRPVRIEGHERCIDNPRVAFTRSTYVTSRGVASQHTRERSVDRVRGTYARARAHWLLDDGDDIDDAYREWIECASIEAILND